VRVYACVCMCLPAKQRYLHPGKCQGDLAVDDACQPCTDADANCASCQWNNGDGGARCFACAHGYTLQTDRSCEDTSPPVLTGCPSNRVVHATSGTTATATWTVPTAVDSLDGAVTPVCDADPGDTFGVATTTMVTCTATDAAGNVATCTFAVRVRDTVDPVVDNCPADISVVADYAEDTAEVTWTAVTASDTSDTAVDVVCSSVSGDTFRAGLTTVTCVATDDEGNEASGDLRRRTFVARGSRPVFRRHGAPHCSRLDHELHDKTSAMPPRHHHQRQHHLH
jgi:hypothetical protein